MLDITAAQLQVMAALLIQAIADPVYFALVCVLYGVGLGLLIWRRL